MSHQSCFAMPRAVLGLTLIATLATSALPATAQSTAQAASGTLTVFAAASLTNAFQEIGKNFQATNPGVTVKFSFGASSALATQIIQGAPADVFASADANQMANVANANLLDGSAQTFIKNRLALIVPAGNPAKIGSLRDLGKPGIKLVLAAAKVPVRVYVEGMFTKLAASPEYGQGFVDAVKKNIVSEETDVRAVMAKVALGEADAGIVYVSDVTPDITAKVIVVPIPATFNPLATYPIATLKGSAQPTLAKAFVAATLSETGQATLVKWGFVTVKLPMLPATITLVNDGKLHITGLTTAPLGLSIDDLKNNFVPHKILVTYLSGTTSVNSTYTGALLFDVLDAAALNLNSDNTNDKLNLFVTATGSDGYQALIGWGEFDPLFGNQSILIAYAQDNQPIVGADKQPGAIQLVVPGDAHGGRYVNNLINLDVRHAPIAK